MSLREPVNSGTHLLLFLLAIPAVCFLIKLSKNKPTIVIYGISILLCYGASAMYHGVHSNIETWQLLDYIFIYCLIGSTYTAVINDIHFIIYMWCLTLFGIIMTLAIDNPKEELYIVISLLPLLSKPAIKFLIKEKTFLIIAGGIIYIAGTLLSKWGKFSIADGIIGPHETFHLFVMTATSLHYYYILKYVVLPYSVSGDEIVSTAIQRAIPHSEKRASNIN